ncbi:MAG: metallophosphoesterase [Acidobacteriaceae bacterium]|nr:metallophosphoesterase [Acidobacteriaceae bacterium]
MKLLIFSDIHSDLAALESVVKQDADLYFAAGDLVNWARGLERVGPILARRADRMYVMPGNHESEADIRRLCQEFGLQPFHGNTIRIGRFHVAGLGYSGPTPFDTPGEYSEEEIARRLEPFAGLKPLVLICHCPPKDTPLDRVKPGLHAGSSSVRAFIEAQQPEYFFCGHIHEAAGVDFEMGNTRCRNVGKKGYAIDLD